MLGFWRRIAIGVSNKSNFRKYNHTIPQCDELNEKRNRRFIKLLSRLERSSRRMDKDMNKKYDRLRTEKLISQVIAQGYEIRDDVHNNIVKLTKSLNGGKYFTIEVTCDEVELYGRYIIVHVVTVRRRPNPL